MTVTEKKPISGPYLSDGVSNLFEFTFKIFEASDLYLRITDLNGLNGYDETDNISVDPMYLQSDVGGYLDYSPAGFPLPAGKIIYVLRSVPLSQPNRIGNQGGFYPETHERTFDLLAMQVQQVSEKVDRSFKAPVGVDEIILNPLPNTLLGWDEDNNISNFDPTAFVNAAGVASASQGVKADSAVQPGETDKVLKIGNGKFWAAEGAKIHRVTDRMFVGKIAVTYDGELPNGQTWVEQLFPATIAASQFGVTSNIGHSAIGGFSRTSDNPGAGSMGCIGGLFVAYNDNTAQIQTAYGLYVHAVRAVGAGTTQGPEIDIVNRGNEVDTDPYNPNAAGMTEALRLASGGEEAANSASHALAIIANGAKFLKGLIFGHDSIIGNLAIAFGQSHFVQWFYPTGSANRIARRDTATGITYRDAAGTETGRFEVTATMARIVGPGGAGVLGLQAGAAVTDLFMSAALGFVTSEVVQALPNGQSNNLALNNGGQVAITGPTAAFSISGIAGGSAGREVVLVNTTTQTLTILHFNAGSLAANQIINPNGGAVTVVGAGMVKLRYSAQLSKWLVV